jgi:hypothetical protein
MFYELDINEVYLYLLKRYTIITKNSDKKCDCKSKNGSTLFIPIKKEKDKMFMYGYCCTFPCMLKFLDHTSDMTYNYSYNVLWTILPFMIEQTVFL